MSLKYYGSICRTQTHCYLVCVPFLFILIMGVFAAMMAGELEVARVKGRNVQPISASSDSHLLGKPHVLVVGAGAAGMSAAYTMEYLGIPYTLLEASSTFGGRVRQMSDFIDLPLDLGAEWIHVMPRVLQDLLLFDEDADSIEIIDYQPRSLSSFVKGKRRPLNWLTPFYQEYKFAKTTWWSYFDTFFYPYISNHTIFDAFVTRIEYNVAQGDNEQGAVTVTTETGQSFTGSHVIVATPVRILQDREISFQPDLDERTWKAVDDVEIADGMKVWFEWDSNFYPDIQLTKPLMRGIESMYFDALLGKPTNHNVSCLFNVNQEEATERASWTDEEIVEYSLNELEEIFGRSDLRDHLLQTKVQNWSREPYIRGAYTWDYEGYDRDAFRQELYDGHLFFAGEHVSGDHTATVHGAAMTGRGAVLKILSQIEN